MALTRKQKISFYKNRGKIDDLIVREIKKRKLILFGARSLNRQLPKFLKKETKDYDIIVTKREPQQVAKELERKLDKRFKGNLFFVEKGKAKGVYKVKRTLGKEGIIDVVKVQEKVPFVKRRGVRVSTLDFEKAKIKESLANPEAKFRHDKDRERRERIRIFLDSIKKRKPRINTVRRRIKPRRKFAPRSAKIRSIPIRTPGLNPRPNF